MTKTEKFLTFVLSAVSGIAIAYMQENKRLKHLNDAQAEAIKELRDYIEWTESDHSKIYTRRCNE